MAAGKNIVINGGMDIWQRGTTSTTNNAYATADRWYQNLGGGSITWSQETSIVPVGSRYAMKVLSGSAGSSTFVIQAIETSQTTMLSGKTVTLSAQCSSSATTDWQLYLSYSTSTDNAVGGTWTDLTPSSGSVSTTTTTTFVNNYNVFLIPSSAKSLRVMVRPATMANGTAAYFGNVQLAEGSVVTTFTRAGGTIQGELAACQRYYYRNTAATNKWILPMCVSATSTTAAVYAFALPVTMRTTPSSLDSSAIQLVDGSAGYAITSLVLSSDSSPAVAYGTVGVASGLTNRAPYSINSTGAAGYVGFNAEL